MDTMRQPTRQQLMDFIHQALQEHVGSGYETNGQIKDVERLEELSLPQLRLVASIILALGYTS